MFHKDHRGVEPSEDFPFFNDLGLAVFKMFSMFMGELEFSDLYRDAMDMEANGIVTDIFTVIVYMGFIFMILMVLTNLLNGLAVSDVAFIAAKAHVDSSVIRLEMIAERESILYLVNKIKGCTTSAFKPEEYWKKVIGKKAKSRTLSSHWGSFLQGAPWILSQKLQARLNFLLEANKMRERLDREADMRREFRETDHHHFKGIVDSTRQDSEEALQQMQNLGRNMESLKTNFRRAEDKIERLQERIDRVTDASKELQEATVVNSKAMLQRVENLEEDINSVKNLLQQLIDKNVF